MLDQYNDVMTTAEVAEALACGKGRIYELLNAGSLKGFKIGSRNWRISKSSLITYIIQRSRSTY